MTIINFKLQKNNKIIISENNIRCINQNNKLLFKINDIKYTYSDNLLVKESNTDIITLDFNKKLCSIYIKDLNKKLYLNLTYVSIEKLKNSIKIKYKIETDNNCINIISLESMKSS